MNRFVESIRITDGVIENIKYHNLRFNTTMNDVFGTSSSIELKSLIIVPDSWLSGIFKCRVVYTSGIEKIEFIPYTKRVIKNLKLVFDDLIDYKWKYEDKTYFDKLKSDHPGFDDILIVKNGLITDTSFSNAAFYDGKDWFTPATPLLKGTKREQLLDMGVIRAADIKPENLHRYSKVSFINAMLDLEESEIDIDFIFST